MDISAFKGLEGKRLSVLLSLTKPNSGEPEQYFGYLIRAEKGFIELDYERASQKANKISRIIISTELILSIWVYKD